MIYLGILEVGSFWVKLWEFIVPTFIMIITVILFARITKGYVSFVDSIRMITSTKRTFFFFIVFGLAIFWVYSQIRQMIGV